MATITKIETQKRKKDRVNVYLDSEFYCALQLETVLKLHLKEGLEIDENQLAIAIEDSETLVAFEKCIDYLSYGMRTSSQLRSYIRKKNFSVAVEERVIAKLKDYNYVNDFTFAQAYCEQSLKNKGAKRIKNELLQKGVHQEIAEKVVDEIDEEAQIESAKLLAQKYMRGKQCSLANQQKLYRYLLQRGFGYDVAKIAIDDFKGDCDNDWD